MHMVIMDEIECYHKNIAHVIITCRRRRGVSNASREKEGVGAGKGLPRPRGMSGWTPRGEASTPCPRCWWRIIRSRPSRVKKLMDSPSRVCHAVSIMTRYIPGRPPSSSQSSAGKKDIFGVPDFPLNLGSTAHGLNLHVGIASPSAAGRMVRIRPAVLDAPRDGGRAVD